MKEKDIPKFDPLCRPGAPTHSVDTSQTPNQRLCAPASKTCAVDAQLQSGSGLPEAQSETAVGVDQSHMVQEEALHTLASVAVEREATNEKVLWGLHGTGHVTSDSHGDPSRIVNTPDFTMAPSAPDPLTEHHTALTETFRTASYPVADAFQRSVDILQLQNATLMSSPSRSSTTYVSPPDTYGSSFPRIAEEKQESVTVVPLHIQGEQTQFSESEPALPAYPAAATGSIRASVAAQPFVPILPKPHTVLVPVECNLQDGNKLVFKTGPAVGICDTNVQARQVFSRAVPRRLLPKVSGSSVSEATEKAAGIRTASEDAASEKPTPGFLSASSSQQHTKGTAGTQTTRQTKIVMEMETQTSGNYVERRTRKHPHVSVRNQSCGTQHFSRVQKKKHRCAQSGTQTAADMTAPPRRRPVRRQRCESSQTTDHPSLHKEKKPKRTKTVAWQTEPAEIPLRSNQVAQSIQTLQTGELQGTLLSVREVTPGGVQSSTSSAPTHQEMSVNTEDLQWSTIETQTLQEMSHNATQTQAMWEELETLLASSSTQTFSDLVGASISTQTLDSFLASNNGALNPRVNSVGTLVDTAQTTSFGMEYSQDSSFLESDPLDPIMGRPSTSASAIGQFGVQTDQSPLSGLFSSSAAQTSVFDDTTAFASIETQTVDEMFEQFLSNIHTQTGDSFFDPLGLSDIQTQTHEDPANLHNSSFEMSTQTDTSHAAAQTSVTMETSSQCLDMETQTSLSVETTKNQSSDSGTQTSSSSAAWPQRQATAETQTHPRSSFSAAARGSLVELTETETQTLLLETLGLNDVPIHSETQTAWNEPNSSTFL